MLKEQINQVLLALAGEYDLPTTLVETFGGNPKTLAQAAEAYVAHCQTVPPGSVDFRDVLTLLSALPEAESSREFEAMVKGVVAAQRLRDARHKEGLKKREKPGKPQKQTVAFISSDTISVLVKLAPARSAPDTWRQLLVDARELSVISLFGESNPCLVYEVLEARPSAREREDVLVGFSLRRLGATPELPQDAKYRARASPETVLGSDDFSYARWEARASLVNEKTRSTAKVLLATSLAEVKPTDPRFAHWLQLLKSSGEKEQVVDALLLAVRLGVGLQHRDDWYGLFMEWADHPGPSKVATAALLSNQFDSSWWFAAFAPNLLASDEAAPRLRKCLARAFEDIAADETQVPATRRRALEALGALGDTKAARRLGRVKDEALKDAVKAARKQLGRAEKGHPVLPELGVKLALAAFGGVTARSARARA